MKPYYILNKEKRMKRVLILMFLCVSAIQAHAAFTHTISDTYVGGYTLNNFESLLITGAGATLIDANDEAYVEVRGTAPLQDHYGGIHSFGLDDYSTLNFYGGEMGVFVIYDDATATFSGGSINVIASHQNSDQLKHITFICDVDSVSVTNNLLTGDWLDGSSFSIGLYDQAGYDSVYSNINFVPEPASLALLGLGGMLLRKRK